MQNINLTGTYICYVSLMIYCYAVLNHTKVSSSDVARRLEIYLHVCATKSLATIVTNCYSISFETIVVDNKPRRNHTYTR